MTTMWEIKTPGDAICPALDVDTLAEAEEALDQLTGCGVAKVGHQLANAVGQEASYSLVKRMGFRLFADVKLFDISRTVGEAARVLSEKHGVDLFNVCAAAGVDAVRAAVENAGDSLVFVMGVPSSMDDEACIHTYGVRVLDKMIEFAEDAIAAEASGLIVSAAIVEAIHEYVGDKLTLLTPALRLPGDDALDQVDPTTPEASYAAGGRILVMGSSLVKNKRGPAWAYEETCRRLQPYFDAV